MPRRSYDQDLVHLVARAIAAAHDRAGDSEAAAILWTEEAEAALVVIDHAGLLGEWSTGDPPYSDHDASDEGETDTSWPEIGKPPAARHLRVIRRADEER